MRRYHQVIVVGGGWAGVSAALSAKKTGIDVAICEKTDMLLGAGLVGGIMRNNGRFVAAEEAIAMGFGDLFNITDSLARHKGIRFPGHNHASLYDVTLIEPLVRKTVISRGITVYMQKRINALKEQDGVIRHLESEDGDTFYADAFVDATGSSGPPGMCQKFGNGCVSCIQRCPSFGPRVSLSSLMGLPEFMSTRRKGAFGAMSGSCKLCKEGLSQELRQQLEAEGVAIIHLPERLINHKKLESKVCQQYALPEYAESAVLLDTGHVKLMSPYFPLEELRTLPGLENARFADPLAGGKGNSIRLTAVSPRSETMKVDGTSNLFVGGERSGVSVGHTEAIVTGALAGRNAGLKALGKPLMTIPEGLAIGDYIRQSAIDSEGKPRVEGSYGLAASYTFAGSVYFERMRRLGLYEPDPDASRKRVRNLGMEGVFALAAL